MSNDGALDATAIGERSAGQGFPLCSIQSEFHSVHFVVIHKQHDFIGDNIIFGSPRGQRPGGIFAFGGDAAGHEGMIFINSQDARIQSGSGQQGLTTVQLHLYAGFEGNVLQFNGNSIFRDSVIMSNDGALDAAAIGAGQGCPLIGIKREGLRILFVSIDNQDSFVGDDIIPGSPGGQCPVLVSSLGSDAAGQETIAAGSYFLQGGRGQQSTVAV